MCHLAPPGLPWAQLVMFAFNFFFIFAPGHNLLALELRKGKSVIPSIFLHVFQVTKKIMVLIFAGDYLMHGKGSSLCFKKEIILVQSLEFFGTNIILRDVASTTRTNNVSVYFQAWLFCPQGVVSFRFFNVFNVLKLSSM